LTGFIILKLRYSDGDTHIVQRTIPHCNKDHKLLDIARELFKKLYKRRMLLRMVGIRFTHLIPVIYQIDLFEDSEETIKLLSQMGIY
jgi:DNA polymerase-4